MGDPGQSTSQPKVGSERLIYRRQFIIGPRTLLNLTGWTTHPVARGSLVAQVHPDLGFTQVSASGRELSLLGYVLDPRHPGRTNEAVLAAINELLDHGTDVFLPTYGLGGRWILIVCDTASMTLFTDPCGLRQVFYSDASLPEAWCASQPFHIGGALGLSVDPQVKAEFLSSNYVATDPEYWYPNDTSPYRGVRRLLPNHALDLSTRVSRRFWPSHPIEPVALDDAVRRSARLLTGQIEAGHRRFPLAVPITGGFDSRTILAATRAVASDVFYYTGLFPSLAPNHPDIAVPAKLLLAIGLEHNVIPCPSRMTAEFEELYRCNADPAHSVAGAIAQGMFGQFPQGYVCVSGHGSEIARCGFYFFADRYPENVTAEGLAHDAGMLDQGCPNAFAVRRLNEWLDEARRVEREHGVRILDLFYWEQRVGIWAAAGEAEWDIVHDRLPVFACRELLTTLLGVDIREREHPNYHVYRHIMMALWPDVLAFPLNPARPLTLRDTLIRAVASTRMTSVIRPIYRLMKTVRGAIRS